MTQYDWLLFDADNTLFDYDKAEATALASSFAQFNLGFTLTMGEKYRAVNAQIWHDYEQGAITQQALRTERFRRLFAAIGLEVAAVRAEQIGQLAHRPVGPGARLAVVGKGDGHRADGRGRLGW